MVNARFVPRGLVGCKWLLDRQIQADRTNKRRRGAHSSSELFCFNLAGPRSLASGDSIKRAAYRRRTDDWRLASKVLAQVERRLAANGCAAGEDGC